MTEDGIQQREWADLEAVGLWQAFLRHPNRMFDVD